MNGVIDRIGQFMLKVIIQEVSNLHKSENPFYKEKSSVVLMNILHQGHIFHISKIQF